MCVAHDTRGVERSMSNRLIAHVVSAFITGLMPFTMAPASAGPGSGAIDARYAGEPLVWKAEMADARTAFQTGSGPSADVCFATPDDGTTVIGSANADAVRIALGASGSGATVKVAGYCAGVVNQNGGDQVALITQSLTLEGGYTKTNWVTYDPIANPTTLDGIAGGRVISAPASATLRGFTVTGGWISSTIEERGGGIHASGAMTLSDMIVSGNTITGVVTWLRGGGAYIGGAASVANTTFSNNIAKTGGGLYAASALVLSGTQFINNWANAGGGGALVDGVTTIDGGLFQGNFADYGGGLETHSTLTLTGTQFISNSATVDGGGAASLGSFAGGSYTPGAASLNGGKFQGNVSGELGGGLWAPSTLVLTGTQFISNHARAGGGAYVAYATLNGGLFKGNSSDGSGGGLYASWALALTGTQFVNNSANAGGGIFVSGNMELSGGLFHGNDATSRGGGIYLVAMTARRISNTLFSRNTASILGAAIYVINAGPLVLVHSTIVASSAQTGAPQAIYVNSGAIYVTNTLIASHTLGIHVAGGAVSSLNTLFAGVTTSFSGTVTSVGGITGAAGFVNPAADDYHLASGSSAIDAGVDAGVAVDFEGDPRPIGAGFDIGYDEYIPQLLWLPLLRR